MNPGKKFEEDWKNSVPDNVYYYRLKDGTAWSPGTETRFTPSNDYDCFMYRAPNLWTLELKSVAGKSIRYDCLRDNQEKGLLLAGHRGAHSGLIVNLRGADNATFYVPIMVWQQLDWNSKKKSINVEELRDNLNTAPPTATCFSKWTASTLRNRIPLPLMYGGVLLEHQKIVELYSEKRISRYRYDIGAFTKWG